jgi:hypothetical protein
METGPPEGHGGLAAKYPGDAGIAEDPAVIFVENFESGELDNWPGGHQRERAQIIEEPANVHSGRRALEWAVPVGDTGGHIYHWLEPGEDTVYARLYWKLAEDWTVTRMHGWGISAQAPGVSVPGDAGRRADGTNKFCALVDRPDQDLTLYVYHPDQKGRYGDGFRSGFKLELGRWYCVEVMQKANRPGNRDGEQALWVDGVLVARWTGLRFRDVPQLKINKVVLMLYLHENPRGLNRCWYDDLVVAREYIGPITPVTAGVKE